MMSLMKSLHILQMKTHDLLRLDQAMSACERRALVEDVDSMLGLGNENPMFDLRLDSSTSALI